MPRKKSEFDKQKAKVDKVHADLRKEHKVPGAVVPSSRTLKTHDLFTERLIRDLKHDPLEELVNLSRSAKSELVKANINLTLLEYMIPKLKAVDTNPNQGEVISINVVMPGQSIPVQAEVLRPGSLPPVTTIESNHYLEEGNQIYVS